MVFSSHEDFIDNVIVQMKSRMQSKDMTYTVGLLNNTSYPMVFSLSDEKEYFNFVQSFKLMWFSVR